VIVLKRTCSEPWYGLSNWTKTSETLGKWETSPLYYWAWRSIHSF